MIYRLLKLLCVLALFLCASCARVVEDLGAASGDPICFSAVIPGHDTSTKTVYSGDTYSVGTSVFERVNWVADDRIRLASTSCPEGYADYKVSEASGYSDQNNSAQIIPVASSGHGLSWGEGEHNFYALYPAPGAAATLSYAGGNSVTLPIPATQTFSSVDTSNPLLTKMLPDMNYAYMGAATTVSGPTSTVSLAFRPLFTAFEITVGSDGANELDLYSFYMTAAQNLSGTYAVTMTAGTTPETWTWTLGTVTGGTNRIDVSLGGTENPTKVSQTKALTFTVFAVPQAVLSEVVLHFETSKGARTLELKHSDDSWVEFTAGQKAVIEGLTIPGTLRIYTIEPIANLDFYGVGANYSKFSVRSYSRSLTNVQRDEKWKIEYSTDYDESSETGSWYNTPAGASASWLDVSGASLFDGSEETLNVKITAQSDPWSSEHGEIKEIHETILKATSAVPNNYDLSMHTIHGDARSLPVTANCYVVKAPGTYIFPLVYGNAIDGTKSDALSLTGIGNVINQEAYQPGETNIPSNAQYFLKRFFNANNQPITSPFIETDLSISDVTKLDAIALWQDGIPYGETTPIPIITATPTLVDGPATSPLSGKCHYISFTIDQARIRQGNIVIALRDVSAGNTASTAKIIWSWQIWVTDEDLHPQEVEMQSGSVQMMPVNVGWCDIQGTVERYDYNDRICHMRITQVGSDGITPLTGGASTIVKVIQHEGIGYTVYEAGTDIPGYGTAQAYLGSSPYYQFGRKDPFLGRDYTAGDPINIKFSAADGYTIDSNEYTVNYVGDLINTSGDVDLGLSIRNPYIYYHSHTGGDGTYHLWYGGLDIDSDLVIGFNNTHGFHNLWNAYSAGRGDDAKVRKTVYDPCPPDFCLPRRNAFTGFTNNGNDQSNQNYVNGVFDSVRDGYHFYKIRMPGTTTKDPSGGSLFFCRTGIRRNGSLRKDFPGWAAYWTAERNAHNPDYAIHLVMNTHNPPHVWPQYETNGHLSDSWSIRPTLEEPW